MFGAFQLLSRFPVLPSFAHILWIAYNKGDKYLHVPSISALQFFLLCTVFWMNRFLRVHTTAVFNPAITIASKRSMFAHLAIAWYSWSPFTDVGQRRSIPPMDSAGF